MNALCVFCGSSPGRDPSFVEAATAFGALLARRSITVVYGGGRVGLMRALANGALSEGGRVIGVIPRALVAREVAHEGATELRVVSSMHERKALMADLADGFVALPGGLGTLEELFEVWTWGQLGLHDKPYGLLDRAGFYEPLMTFLRGVAEERFVRPEHLDMLLVDEDPERLLERMAAHRAPALPKWIDRAET